MCKVDYVILKVVHAKFDQITDFFQHPTQVAVRDRVFEVLHYFCKLDDGDIKIKAFSGIGFLCNRHADFLLGTDMKELYWGILLDKNAPIKMLCQVLKNLQMYLQEEDERMRVADAECKLIDWLIDWLIFDQLIDKWLMAQETSQNFNMIRWCFQRIRLLTSLLVNWLWLINDGKHTLLILSMGDVAYSIWLCWSSRKCNCAWALLYYCSFLPSEVGKSFCAGKNFVTAQTQLCLYSEWQGIGISNIC